MSNSSVHHCCELVKAWLVEHGGEGLSDHPELGMHIDKCATCQQLLRAWNEIPELLEALPEHEPAVALTDKVQATVAAADPVSASPGSRRRYLAPSLASAAALLAAFGISYQLVLQETGPQKVPADFPQGSGQMVGRDQLRAVEKRPNAEPIATDPFDNSVIRRESELKELNAARSRITAAQSLEESPVDTPALQSPGFDSYSSIPEEAHQQDAAARLADRDGQFGARGPNETFGDERAQRRAAEHLELDSVIVTGGKTGEYAQPSKPAEETAAPTAVPEGAANARKNIDEGVLITQNEALSPDSSYFRADGNLDGEDHEKADAEPTRHPLSEVGGLSGTGGETGAEDDKEESGDKLATMGVASESTIVPEFNFLAHYQRTEGLDFQPASGYWANTYVPGDPEIRLLNARLAEWDRSWLPDPTLERAVEPIAQPFDAPDDHTLALSLMADAAALPADGSLTRFRLQVGIQGIEHRRGTRPAMNLAMVVDIPPAAPDSVRISANALIDALLASRQAGDRFALVLTGQPGHGPGLVLPPDEFRFGSLDLAKQIVNAEEGSYPELVVRPEDLAAHRMVLDPLTAMQRATELVRDSMRDDAAEDARPIGSSSVLLLSARELPGLGDLSALAHDNARNGITLSVVPLGAGASNAQAEQLVLAGLGQRRYLEAPAEARDLIESELHAASQAVARAARLSIRLAPGVQLVDVVGSERLDAHRAQRVRDIENAMDRRLAQHLGIQADRGEDEDGIQIVIPSIYSGDALTVLLDVVAPGPGPVAEVTLRYKDLVYRRNGALHGQLDLPRGDTEQPALAGVGQPPRGPAELSVLKNLLAHHFTAAVETAAEALGNSQPDEALEALLAIYQTYEFLRLTLPALNGDADLIRDQNVLEHYMEALRAPGARENAAELADSLRLAAWAKTHGQPETWQ